MSDTVEKLLSLSPEQIEQLKKDHEAFDPDELITPEELEKQSAIFEKVLIGANRGILHGTKHTASLLKSYGIKSSLKPFKSAYHLIERPQIPSAASALRQYAGSVERFMGSVERPLTLYGQLGPSISTIYHRYSDLFSVPWQPIFDNAANRFSESFTESALRFCNTCEPESLNVFAADDGHSELPEFIAHSISEMTGLKSECFEKSSREGFVKTKTSIIENIIIPILIAVISVATPLAYTIWHDHKQDLETKAYQEKMLQEKHLQTIELQKQTKLLQKLETPSND